MVCVMQVDTLVLYLFIISLDNVFLTSIDLMKENGFTLETVRSRRYPAETIMDADNPDDIALLVNTLSQAESLQHSLERVAGSTSLHVNTDKTECMCINKRGDISTPNGISLKLGSKSTYLRNIISSRENDINTQLTKT